LIPRGSSCDATTAAAAAAAAASAAGGVALAVLLGKLFERAFTGLTDCGCTGSCCPDDACNEIKMANEHTERVYRVLAAYYKKAANVAALRS
jgi:hypothetical protein